MGKKFFDRFTLYELIVIVVMAALGIAIKPIIVPLAHLVCGPLMIPSGAMAGGLYMMWLVMGYGLVKRKGSALLIGVIQALLVVFTGIVGSHGIMSFLTYIAPGVAIELVMLIMRHKACCRGCCVIGTMAANIVGTICVNFVFFRTPGAYLILVIAISALSGIIGGLIAWELIRIFDKFDLGSKGKKGQEAWTEE